LPAPQAVQLQATSGPVGGKNAWRTADPKVNSPTTSVTPQMSLANISASSTEGRFDAERHASTFIQMLRHYEEKANFLEVQ